MTLNDRLRQVIEEYARGMPLARNFALTFQLFFTDDNMKLVGATVADTITGKVTASGETKPRVAKGQKRVLLTDAKLKLVERDIRNRRMLAGPEQPVQAHRGPDQFRYLERER